MSLAYSAQVLNSRVARRLLGLVVLLVICPVVLTALIAYESINRQVASNIEAELHTSAKSYLLDVLGRLRIANRSLQGLIFRLEEATFSGPIPVSLGAAVGLSEVVAGRVEGPFAGLPRGVQAEIRGHHNDAEHGDKTRIVFLPAGSEPADTYLVRSWGDGAAGRFVAARVDPAFLWESAQLAPFGHQYCLTTTRGIPVYCPEPGLFRLAGASDKISSRQDDGQNDGRDDGQDDGRGDAGVWRFEAGGEPYLASAWEAHSAVEFGALDLSATAAQTESVLKSPLYSFVRTVPPALGIAVLSAVLLAMIVIRRRMRPLDQLTVAAAQLARGDFSTAVSVDADDEFLGLARMFDDMRLRLGQQFAELSILSKVDQAILEMASLASIIERYTLEIAGVFPGRLVGTILLDRDVPGRVQLFCPEAGRVSIARRRLPAAVVMAWEAAQGPLTADQSLMQMLKLPESGAERMEIVPIRDEDRLVGVLCAELLAEAGPAAQARRLLAEFAGRLAVAAANIRHRERLYVMGHYDELTGLPNRQLLRERLRNALRTGVPGETAGYLLFIDLDGFKRVNDAEGHPIGDALLREAAQRIAGCLRDEDSVFRLGGDEFTVLSGKLSRRDQALDVADRIIASLRIPYRVASLEHFLSASIGIVEVAGGASGDSDSLVRNADLAMYAAKDSGGNKAVFFESAMHAAAEHRVSEESALRAAVDAGELVLYYQPQLDTQSGRVTGAEALMRWNRPGTGIVGPAGFIQLAEDTGLIRELGAWALRNACQTFRRWRDAGVQLDEVSVNCSMRQLKDADFVNGLERVLAETGMPRGALIVEITESLMAEDLVRAADRLRDLRRLGVRVSIDDFGTGYSSLGYLRDFPVDELKIDRSFFTGVPGNSQAESVIEAIIELGSRLGKCVVAEGIETAAQHEYLRQTRCPRVQGYLFAPPLPEEKFLAFVSARNSRGLRSVA